MNSTQIDKRDFLRLAAGASAVLVSNNLSRFDAAASIQGEQAPAPATGAGYLTKTFYDDFNDIATIDTSASMSAGFNWYPQTTSRLVNTKSDNISVANSILTLGGGTGTLAALTSAFFTSSISPLSSWTPSATTIAANSAVAPDDTTTAVKVTEKGTATQHYIASETINIAANGTYTFSVSAKADTETLFSIWLVNPATGDRAQLAVCDASAGTIDAPTGEGSTPFTGIAASVVADTHGYYRFTVTGTTTGGAIGLQARLYPGGWWSGAANTNGLYFWGAQLQPGSVATSYDPHYRGSTFGGGGYFEARIRFDPTLGTGATQWPAFWGEAIESPYLNLDRAASQWPGQVNGYTHYSELDFFEAYWPAKTGPFGNPTSYLGTINNWYGPYPENVIRNYDNNLIALGSVDWNLFHVYGTLWVPQSGNTPGHATWYFDDNEMITIYWRGPPGSPPLPFFSAEYPSYTPSSIGQADRTYSILDSQNLALILSGDPNWPIYVDWVKVWQLKLPRLIVK